MRAAPIQATASCRTPTLHRSFTLLVSMTLVLWSWGAQAQPLTEADVSRLAREHNPQREVRKTDIALQEASRRRAGILASPSVSWQREHLPTVTGSEDIVMLNVPINRTRRQKLAGAVAQQRVAESRSAAAVSQGRAVRRALELFYLSLAQQERIEIEDATYKRLFEATRIVTRRREEGRLSGYDLARVQLETELVQSRVQEARTALASLHSELALLIGRADGSLVLRGSLKPQAERAEGETSTESPAIAALRAAAGFADDANRSATTKWVPVVAASAGLKVTNDDETNLGYVAGLTVRLPFRTGTSAVREETRARTQRAKARVAALQTERSIRGASAMQTLKGLRAEAERFSAATDSQVLALQKSVESGYREGQRTLIELLDANRTLTSVRARALTLSLAIKQAELALRAARGEFE